jgi:hypothetical protein
MMTSKVASGIGCDYRVAGSRANWRLQTKQSFRSSRSDIGDDLDRDLICGLAEFGQEPFEPIGCRFCERRLADDILHYGWHPLSIVFIEFLLEKLNKLSHFIVSMRRFRCARWRIMKAHD